MKKIAALIPARGGSKGVPRKNIKTLGGKPLIFYSIQACLDCDAINRVIVSTEDLEIATIAKECGAEIPFLRPKELAQDNSTDYDVLNNFFDQVNVQDVVLIRPTTPLRDIKKLDLAIKHYYNNIENISSMRSVHEIPESPYKLFKISKAGFCEGLFDNFNGIKDYTNLPRQTFPPIYQPNGYIDIIKKETVSKGSAYGHKILPFLTEEVIEIDTNFQFDLLELKIKAIKGETK